MTLDDLKKLCARMHEEAQAKFEADFAELCAAITKAADEGFARAQADLDRQRGETAE